MALTLALRGGDAADIETPLLGVLLPRVGRPGRLVVVPRGGQFDCRQRGGRCQGEPGGTANHCPLQARNQQWPARSRILPVPPSAVSVPVRV